MCRWRHKIRKIAVEILQSVKNRTQSLWEIAYYAWLLLTYIVINTLLGRVTRHPAGMHCPWWDDAFVSSLFVCLLKTKPGLVALYDIWPGNGAGPFLQPRSPHGAQKLLGCTSAKDF